MKHRFQKSLSLIFTFLLLFSLIGCSNSSVASKKVDTSEKNVKVTQIKKDKKQQEETKENKVPEQSGTATNQQNTTAPEANAATAPPETNQQPAAAANTSPPVQNTQANKSKTLTNAPTNQRTVSPAPAPAPVQVPKKTVKINITGPTGTILNWTAIEIKGNETIFDVLLKATGDKKIYVDHTGSGATAYVRGIDDYYERDPKYGAMSGWICKLNGTGISKSAGAISVNDGDKIEWIYQKK